MEQGDTNVDEKEISQAVISRLPRYYRYLGELKFEGVERISSQELSELMKVTASQIRQDFNNFGGFGQQGYGYNVEYLYQEIGKILGLDKKHMEKYANEPYIRVLGFDKKGQEYLSYIRKTVEVPLITKTADYKEMLLDDIHAANIYNMIVAGKYGVKEFGDFVRGPVRV